MDMMVSIIVRKITPDARITDVLERLFIAVQFHAIQFFGWVYELSVNSITMKIHKSYITF